MTGRKWPVSSESASRRLRSGIRWICPVTDATYWSDTAGEARATAHLLAFNHNRAHILAPHKDVDPWHGLDRAATAGGPVANESSEVPGPAPAPPAQDPWADLPPQPKPEESQGGGWG